MTENNDVYDWWLRSKNNDVMIDDENSKITMLNLQNSDRWNQVSYVDQIQCDWLTQMLRNFDNLMFSLYRNE